MLVHIINNAFNFEIVYFTKFTNIFIYNKFVTVFSSGCSVNYALNAYRMLADIYKLSVLLVLVHFRHNIHTAESFLIFVTILLYFYNNIALLFVTIL